VKRKHSALAEARTALIAMAVEGVILEQAVGGGSITEAVAGWLAPQYAVAMRKQLAGLEGEDHLKLLHAFVQDWALLRHGDQTAERLRIERERLEVASRDANMKWKRKIIIAMDALNTYMKKHPEAQATFAKLAEQVRHPFDPDEKVGGKN
jgi:hypothetical protein